MNSHLFKVLEYNKIKGILKKNLLTHSGERHLKELMPSNDYSNACQMQIETTEMKNIIENQGRLPLIPLGNIEDDVKKARIQGSIISVRKLLIINKVLECIYLVKEYFNSFEEQKYPSIKGKINNLKVFRLMEKEIKRCINEDAEIVDEASPELKKVRRNIRNTEKKIRDRLENILRDPRNRSSIQDDIITIRQGRFVLPIKQQEKGKFPGIVHDKSESGVTYFVEPLAVLELNNQLREFYTEEEKEEFRILQKLTALVGKNGADIVESYHNLGEIDLIHSKAKYSIQISGNEPRINNKRIINLKSARHPLLKDSAIPIDIEIGENFDVLVITGPNTGGKTVTLKTVGLLCLMAQSGLHIPAGIDSEMAIFKQIFADIGDEQSIEQNLSTFSAHMKNIIQILKDSDDNTLALLDELGSGTDPSEGSALSMAILDSLRKKGTKIISSTHHDSIKAYAYLTDRVMNARMEFDEETLQPTYKITIGLPGKSCAFSVAQKLGLEELVIKGAQKYLDKEKADLENMIRKMERDKSIMADNLKITEREKEESLVLKKELKLKNIEFEKEKEKIIQDAYRKAEDIISLTEKRAKEIINNLKRKNINFEKYNDEYRNLKDLYKEIKEKIIINEKQKENKKLLSVGDVVLIKSLNMEGIVIENNHKKEQCLIQVNQIKMNIPFDDIEKINKKISNEERYIETHNFSISSYDKNRLEKKAEFKNEINIRQMTVNDAKIKLEKYLDDAFLLNVSPVYIIHGKGKGILRSYVNQLLNQLSYVKSYRYGELYEGGEGVTVVYF